MVEVERQYNLRGKRGTLMQPLTILLIDPGKTNVLSYGIYRIDRRWGVTKLEQGFLTGRTYDACISHASDQNIFENTRRETNAAYNIAVKEMQSVRKKTAKLETFSAYVRMAAQHYQVLAKEAVSYLRRDRRYLSQREQQQCMDKAAREICCNRSAEVDLVFFGNGSLRHSRSHAPVSTKGFARAFGRIKPTIIIDEYKTSSWCPLCENRLHRRSSQSNSSVLTMPIQGNFGERLISEDTPDNRMECCAECGSEFPHDVVSIENFLQIALALLKGECRPAYLTRMTLEQQVRSMMLDEEQ